MISSPTPLSRRRRNARLQPCRHYTAPTPRRPQAPRRGFVARPSSLVASDTGSERDKIEAPKEQDKQPEKAATGEEASHIDRLLAAKRRKTGQDEHDHLDNR